MAVLQTESLAKNYGATRALDGLDLEIGEGGPVGLLGPNGAGKTTLIRLLLGLLRPTAGAARIEGRDCWRARARIHRDLGYLPGDLHLYSRWTGERILRLFGRIRRRDVFDAGRELAGRFDLNLGRRVSDLSKGNRQKLGIVLALAHAPRLVILDEPTNSLDPLIRDALMAHLRRMADDGHVILFSSHTLSEVEQLCDRVVILRRGRMAADTTLEAIRKKSARSVAIHWKTAAPSAAAAEAPAGLALDERRAEMWRGRWHGPAGPLLEWLASPATPAVEDLELSPPDLELVFQEYYRD